MGGTEVVNKPGKAALDRVQDKLDGYIITDAKRKGGGWNITNIH